MVTDRYVWEKFCRLMNVSRLKKNIFEIQNQFAFILALDGDCDETSAAEGWVVASESCGFLSIGAQYVREVFPGEIIEMTKDGIRTIDIVDRPENKAQAFCIFEYVYFARADSMFEGQMVYNVRMQCGRQLAIENPVEADIVSSVPESGTAAAHGFSRQVNQSKFYQKIFILKGKLLPFRRVYRSRKFYVKIDTWVVLLFNHRPDYVSWL